MDGPKRKKKRGENMKSSAYYTAEQKAWLKEHANMHRFQSKHGRIRIAKVRQAFEHKFGETRTRQAIGYQIRILTKGPYPCRKKVYVKKEKGITFAEVEQRLTAMLDKIQEIKAFVR